MTDNEELEPGLYIISLPIGNAKDITIRALEYLRKVDEIYCEDTRVTRKLFSIYEIKKKLNVYHDHNGELVRPKIIKKIKEEIIFQLKNDGVKNYSELIGQGSLTDI